MNIETEEFNRACENGDTKKVLHLLSLTGNRSVDVDNNCGYGFMQACSMGHLEIVEILLGLDGDKKIYLQDDLMFENDDPVRETCMSGQVDVLKYLLRINDDRKIDIRVWDCYFYSGIPRSKRIETIQTLMNHEINSQHTINSISNINWYKLLLNKHLK